VLKIFRQVRAQKHGVSVDEAQEFRLELAHLCDNAVDGKQAEDEISRLSRDEIVGVGFRVRRVDMLCGARWGG
jgi:hypothetical protein